MLMAPRIGSRKKKGSDAPVRVVGPGDNQAQFAAEQAQLLSLMARIGEKQRVADKLKAEHKAAQEEVTEVYRHGKLLGYERQELAELYKDMTAKNQGEIVEKELRRRHQRELVSLPTGEKQIDAFRPGSPAEVRDEHRFWAEGCAAYRRGEECAAPGEISQRFQKKWLEGWHAGQAATAAAMAFQEEADAHKASETKAAAEAAAKAKAEAKAPADEVAPDAGEVFRPKAEAYGYQVEENDEKTGFICTDPDGLDFGGTYLTKGLAWDACNKDLEKQQGEGKFLAPKDAAAEPAPDADESEAEGDVI